jgi:chlorophyll(ide) b reductase
MNNFSNIISNKQRRIQLEKQLKSSRQKKEQLKVVITGGSRGLGKSMTKEFINKGDKVFIISRNEQEINKLVDEHENVFGIAADIGDIYKTRSMFDDILEKLGGEIDMFVNCAGQSGGNRPILDLETDKLQDIIKTNLLGTSLCCKYAFDIMNSQETGGAIFNFTGAGSNGTATPNYSIYGATKSGIYQFTKTLQQEWRQYPVDVHLVSPGMLFTDLLLENMNGDTYDAIKMLIAEPDIVAYHIVPRMRNAYFHAKEDNYIKFLTVLKIIYKMISNST